MARSVSRSRKTASKSPARVKRQATPKSEPKKNTTPKSEPKKQHLPKGHSRSRSASRGRKRARKHSVKKDTRSKSYSRELAALKIGTPPKKTSPPKHAEVTKTSSSTERAEVRKVHSSKTPTMKPHASKTPSMKTPASKSSSLKPSSTKTVLTSSERASRPPERKLFTSAPMEPEFRQRFLRHESSSRSPAQVRVKRQAASFCSSLCNRVYGTVYAAGRCICGNTRAAYNAIVANRREIVVTIVLLLLVALITYFILYTDPAKTRAFIHSIPGNVHAWYLKNFGRK